jgi:hypothetical protein
MTAMCGQPSKLVILIASAANGKARRPGSDDDRLVPDDRGSCKGPPPDCHRIVIRLRYGIKRRSDRTEHRSKCLVNVHANQPLTPPLRRLDRQQSVRWGSGAGQQNRSRELAVPVACPIDQSPGYLTVISGHTGTVSELWLSSSRQGRRRPPEQRVMPDRDTCLIREPNPEAHGRLRTGWT